jgi:2'-5' RNA ligase
VSKRIVIAYWLMPAEPARSFFKAMIGDLGRQYRAPVFEPHMTIHVGSDQVDAEAVITTVGSRCRPLPAKMLEVCQSGEFVKTLFVEFTLDGKLEQLNKMIRDAAQDSSDYQLKPHLSLLYKKMSIAVRRRLARSIKLPFSTVSFDSIEAVRCVSPTKTPADVEAWRVIATRALSG